MMLPRRSTILGGAALAAGAAAVPARAQLTIDMTRPTFEPVPIAIVDFAGDRVGADIASVVRNDLQNSGLFRSIPPRRLHPAGRRCQTPPPRFPTGAASARPASWSARSSRPAATSRSTSGCGTSWSASRRPASPSPASPPTGGALAHIIADAIYKRVTGEEGYFDTRIAYVAESGPGNARVKRIAIMDQDGANNRYITDGRTIAITPRFSPTLQEIVYMAYAEDRSPPRVYLQNVDCGRRELLGNFPGMSFAPRFSPDGTKVVMSISENGQSDIYEMDVRGRALRRLTNTPAIDTSPCYSNDGTQIVFNSDRGGSQQLYVMSAGGGGERRISFGEGRYATPVWSPRGDWIAFTKITGGSFGIGVMRPDGGGERMLASASWSRARPGRPTAACWCSSVSNRVRPAAPVRSLCTRST